jgi:peptidoglycan/LPS O-acetylase OafA/YrhL
MMESPAKPGRMPYLDGLRGLAIVAMVVNHTGRWWIDRSFGWPRYHLIYITTTVAAPIFLFLVGFCQAIAHYNATVRREQSFATVAPRYLRRGVEVILAGYLLNLVVFCDFWRVFEAIAVGSPGLGELCIDPPWQLGVLQTIGFSIIALVPGLAVIGRRWGRALIVVVSVTLYVLFSVLATPLSHWLTGHPLVAQLVFADFPPWPWTTLVLISAVFGWNFCVANQRDPHALTRYFTLMAGAGVVCLLAFVAYDTWNQTPVRLGFMRDFIVNRHWTPRGISLLWIGAVLFLSTPVAYYLMDVRGWAPRWLVDLGQTAMVLYFVHQVIVFTIVKRWLGVAFDSWLYYGIANAALMVLLLYLGRAWLMIRPRLRRRPSSDRELARSPA